MADILKSIVQFAGVEPGDSASLAHGINIKSYPQTPDELTVDNGAFKATADEINVTVTNVSSEVAGVGVLCEMWHSIPRVFGKSFQSVQDSLPIRPFVGAGAGSDATGSDELVAISDTDTTPDFLQAKLVAGTGVLLSKLNPGDDEQLLVSVPDLTSMMASIRRLADGLSGDILQVLLHPSDIEIAAADLNAAPVGTFMYPFYAECQNGLGAVLAWANFGVKEVPDPGDGVYVPAVPIGAASPPSVADSAWVNGQLTSVVTFADTGGVVYAPGDEITVELKMSPTDIFLGFPVAPVTQKFVVV